jgi:hypothetical protein
MSKKTAQTEGTGNVNPVTEITQVIESEAANLRTTITVLGERRKLANDALALYDLLARGANIAAGTDETEIGALLVMLPLMAACRFQLTMSVLQNWRGRAVEALAPLRRATEMCGAACYIRKNPALAGVWLSASDSNEAYKLHKETFKIKVIFPKGDPTLNHLFEIFDFTSKVIHNSIFAIAGQTQTLNSTFQYFDVKGPGDPTLIRTFIYIVSAHESMIRAFLDAFRGALTDEPLIERELRTFSERLQRHRDTLREFAISDLSAETRLRLKQKAQKDQR